MFRPATSPPTLFTLVYLTAVSVLTLNMFLPSLPSMAAEFGVDFATAGLIISGYLAITAVLQLIFGPLSDRFGRRPVMLGCLAAFVFASVICVITESFAVFMTARLLQGASAAGMALSRAIVRDIHGPQDAAAKLGLIGMAMAIAPMLGPAFGGVLEQFLGWRASFVTFVILGIFAFWLAWADLGETNTNRHASFTAQFRTYPELLRSRRFWGYSLAVAFGVGSFFGFITGLPVLAPELGLTPTLTGLAIGTPTFGFFFGNFFAGQLTKRYDILPIAIAGRLATVAGLFAGLLAIWLGVSPLVGLVIGALGVGVGNGLTTPTATAGLMSVRPHLAGSASGLSGSLTVAFGALMTTGVTMALPPANGVPVLLSILFVAGLAGLMSVLYVRLVDRREGSTA